MAPVPPKLARWSNRLKLHEVQVAAGQQSVGGSAVLPMIRQRVVQRRAWWVKGA